MNLQIRRLGMQDYLPVWQAMQAFTNQRDDDTPDEFWALQHPPVYTLGQAGKREHLLNPEADIPLIKVDRGGQVTYHGPGQVIIYVLIDLKRRQLGVRRLVEQLEQAIISLVAGYGIQAVNRPQAPGVYVDGRKLAALGLRIRNGRSFHGLSLNVDMDLEPFTRINPCGYAGLETTQCRDLGIQATPTQLSEQLLTVLAQQLGYNPPLHSFSDLPL